MGRPSPIVPKGRLTLNLPVDLLAALKLLLYSDLEKKVPYGAYSELAEVLFRRYIEKQQEKDKLSKLGEGE